MKNVLTKTIVGGAVLISLLGMTGVAHASPASDTASANQQVSWLSDEQIQGIRDRSNALGESIQVQNTTVENLKKGIWPQSAIGGVVVDEQQVKQGRDDVSLKTYADGSKSKTVFQTPVASTPGSVQPRSIGECRDQDGVGVFPFTACKITSQVSAYMIEFYADGRKRSNGSNQAFAASIDRVYGGSYVGAGNPGEGRGEIFEQYQVGDNPARARWSFTVSGGVAGTTLSVTFYVRNGDRWDTNP